MMAPRDKEVVRLAQRKGWLTPEQLEDVRKLQEREGVPLSEILVRSGYLTRIQMEEILAHIDSAGKATLRVPDPGPRTRPTRLPPEVERAAGRPGSELGNFILVERLGRGGMGEVWKAWDRKLGRHVALKFLQYASDDDRRRMMREARIAAGLEHPEIVPVYEVGDSDRGPYIVMKFIEGTTLDRADLTLRQKLLAIRDAALAAEYAHARGIVHRDIKPQNILVEQGADGPSSRRPPTSRRTKDPPPKIYLTDFGIAKQVAVETSVSARGIVAGTPAYMPPEQARGTPEQIDASSDVYALGATLYRLVTGTPPFQGRDVLQVIEKVVKRDPLPPRFYDPDLPKDVQTIILKCLEKSKVRRYASARALAEDLERVLEGQPILARPVGPITRLIKFARRRPALVTILSLIGLFLVSAAAGSAMYIESIRAEREQTLREKRRAEKERAQAEEARRRAERSEAEARRYAAEAERARRDAERRLAESRVAQADALLLGGRWLEAKEKYARARDLLLRNGEDPLPADLGMLAACRIAPPPLTRFDGHETHVRSTAFRSDGITAVSVDLRGIVHIWDLRTGRPLQTHRLPGDPPLGVALSPGGRRIAFNEFRRAIHVWDAENHRRLAAFPTEQNPITVIAFGPDGRFLAAGDRRGVVVVFDTVGEKAVDSFKLSTRVRALSVSKGLLAAADLFTIVLRDPNARRSIRKLALETPGRRSRPREALQEAAGALRPDFVSVALSSDSRRLLCGCEDGSVRLWDVQTGTEVLKLGGHRGPVTAVAFSPDGRLALSGDRRGGVRLWNLERNAPALAFEGHAGEVSSVCFSPDGRFALTGARDGTVFVWAVGPPPEDRTIPMKDPRPETVAISPDGRLVASDHLNSLQIRDASTGLPLRTLDSGHGARDINFAPQGHLVAAALGHRKVVGVWDVRSGAPLLLLEGHEKEVTAVAFSPDGTRLLSGGEDHTVRLWDVRTGRELRRFKGHPAGIRSVAFTPDGRLAVSADHLREVRGWDVVTGEEVWTARTEIPYLRALAVTPDGRILCGGRTGLDGRPADIEVLDARSGKPIGTWKGHAATVQCLAVSADGRLAMSGDANGILKIWDSKRGVELRSFVAHEGGVTDVAFSADGNLAASTGAGPALRLYALRFDPVPEKRAREVQSDFRSPLDGAGLAALGEWFASRGVHDWAAQMLEAARADGVRVSPLVLGRCYLEGGRVKEAGAEFERALKGGDAPESYLRLLVGRLRR